MTRDEHLAWCKERALEYLPRDPQNAMTSMLSDLSKHDETKQVGDTLAMVGMGILIRGADPLEVERFVNGFR